jgi:hypothetical protein
VDLRFQSGDSVTGFDLLDAALRDRPEWLYRLPCFDWLDEVRDTPRYRALSAAVGAMPER